MCVLPGLARVISKSIAEEFGFVWSVDKQYSVATMLTKENDFFLSKH